MDAKVKSRIWSALAIGLFVLSAFSFLMPLLFAADFLRPGSGIGQWVQFLLGIALIPLILFSLGMICRNNAREQGAANNTPEGIRRPADGSPKPSV